MPTKTFLKIHVEIAYYSFIFYSIGIEITNTFLHSRSSPKTTPDSRPKRHKTKPLGAEHSYMAHMREDSPLPPGAGGNLEMASSQSLAHETSTNFCTYRITFQGIQFFFQ